MHPADQAARSDEWSNVGTLTVAGGTLSAGSSQASAEEVGARELRCRWTFPDEIENYRSLPRVIMARYIRSIPCDQSVQCRSAR